MVRTVKPKAKATPRKPIPTVGKPAASTPHRIRRIREGSEEFRNRTFAETHGVDSKIELG
jgi:hypothetical protein